MKKKFIKFFLTLFLWFFAIRQIMIFNELPTALFLFFVGVCVSMADDN
jgi:hypothetical protein